MWILAVSPADSAAVVALFRDFFSVSAPWLNQAVVDWLTAFVLGVPVMAIVLAWERVGVLVRGVSPWFNAAIGKKLERWSFIINPVLAAIIAGTLWGDSRIGLAAGVAWGVFNSGLKSLGKTSLAGLTKAKTIAVLAGALLALQASTASALPKIAGAEIPALSMARVGIGIGAGERWDQDWLGALQSHHWIAGQLGWSLSDHVGLRTRARLDLDLRHGWFKKNPWDLEAGAWLTF